MRQFAEKRQKCPVLSGLKAVNRLVSSAVSGSVSRSFKLSPWWSIT